MKKKLNQHHRLNKCLLSSFYFYFYFYLHFCFSFVSFLSPFSLLLSFYLLSFPVIYVSLWFYQSISSFRTVSYILICLSFCQLINFLLCSYVSFFPFFLSSLPSMPRRVFVDEYEGVFMSEHLYIK
jgi:hypothetical protein